MKKFLLTLSFIFCLLASLWFLFLSAINLIYANSRTLGINILGFHLTGEGISLPLYLITIQFLIGSVLLFLKLKGAVIEKKKLSTIFLIEFLLTNICFLALSALNLFMADSLTVSIPLLCYYYYGDRTSIPLHLVTLLSLIITGFLVYGMNNIFGKQKAPIKNN